MTTYTEEWVTAQARSAYAHGQASFTVRPERTALLVIDMQDEFLRPGWSPYWVPAATRMAPRLRTLVEQCRALSVPVVRTVFDDTHLGLDRPYALQHLPHAGTGWRLRNLGRDTVVVTGTLTNYCCGTTARQAYERGYRVVFGSDVTATDDESRQEPELAVLRKGFALVLSADEIAQRLTA
ncbi:isochorismatase family cysteine hydrolase [Streptomyces morookaense]|uniref:cysteine hydrolase family protein n=1 Tax=Streptomyces morookaense TaxID=1970 RepID=UPI0033F0EC23